jgi:hypothetical protein
MNGSKLLHASAVALIGTFLSGQAEADPLSASLTLDSVALRSTDRLVVTVTGTYTCGPIVVDDPNSDFGTLEIFVSQAAGQSITRGSGGRLLQCDGNSQEFEVLVFANDRPWHGGQARASGSVFVQDCTTEFQCDNAGASAEGPIHVRGGENE